MKVVETTKVGRIIARIVNRGAVNTVKAEPIARKIIADVRKGRDKALRKYAEEWDGLGKGQPMLSNLTGVGGKIVSGWAIHGASAFQTGTPLNLSTAALLANDSDADFGTVLTITDVSSFSSAGGSVGTQKGLRAGFSNRGNRGHFILLHGLRDRGISRAIADRDLLAGREAGNACHRHV